MKILGSDFDGTFNIDGINEEKIEAISLWRRQGNRFGIVSGRNPGFINYFRSENPNVDVDFFATCNGGYITDGEGNVIYEAPCREVDAKTLTEDLFNWGCRYAHINGSRYAFAVVDMADRVYFIKEEDTFLLENLPEIEFFYQVSVRLDTLEQTQDVICRIKEKYGSIFNTLQNATCIDIVPQNVNKAQGLYRLMEYYGAKKEDVIAVGDNINDVDMIKEFRSYAMENGLDEVKELAGRTVASVTEIFRREL